MDESMSVLIHGLSKSGKSTLAVTAPAPRLYLDVESAARFLPIVRVPWNPHTEAPPTYDGTWDTCVVATRTWEDVMSVYQWLNSGAHPFESLIIDSISELQSRYIEKVGGRSQLTMQQWGDVFRQVSGLCRDIRDLTMHPTKPLRMIALTAMTKQVDGMWKPYVSGQLGTVLPYLWDLNAYLWVEQVRDLTGGVTEVRRLLTRRSATIEAGERVQGRLPEVIDSPNLTEMLFTVFPPAAAPTPPPAGPGAALPPTPSPMEAGLVEPVAPIEGPAEAPTE